MSLVAGLSPEDQRRAETTSGPAFSEPSLASSAPSAEAHALQSLQPLQPDTAQALLPEQTVASWFTRG